MVDIKHRMKLTKDELSRILNERKAIPRAESWRLLKTKLKEVNSFINSINNFNVISRFSEKEYEKEV